MVDNKNFTELIQVAGSDAYLLTGGEKTALFDCGMAYTYEKLIKAIEQKLQDKDLDCLFLTHSHYDHIGALPYLKMRWPGLTVYGAHYAQYVFTRPGAQKVIKEYGFKAAEENGVDTPDYSDELLTVDKPLEDGAVVDLGGHRVQAVELLGHTRCSMGFFIDDEVLFLSESTGLYDQSGIVHPTFVLSYKDALASINKCRRLSPKSIVPPHGELLNMKDIPDYWQKCEDAVKGIHTFVSSRLKKGEESEKIIQDFVEHYWVKDIKEKQPLFAFLANARVAVDAIVNDR